MAEWLSQYGYIGIILFLILGIVGIPLPDEIFMTFIGYLASEGQLNLYLTYFSALTGSVGGITLSYVLETAVRLPPPEEMKQAFHYAEKTPDHSVSVPEVRQLGFVFWLFHSGKFPIILRIWPASPNSHTPGSVCTPTAGRWSGAPPSSGWGMCWVPAGTGLPFPTPPGSVFLLVLILAGGLLAWYWWTMSQSRGSRPK